MYLVFLKNDGRLLLANASTACILAGMAERDRVDATKGLSAALIGVGLGDKRALKLLKQFLERGEVQLVVEAVASVLLYENQIKHPRIPRSVGRPTRELASIAEGAITEVVAEYHQGGNPLTDPARGFVEPLQLVAEMCKLWIAGFRLIQVTSRLVPELDQEKEDRLTVTALCLRALIARYAETLEDGRLALSDDALEGLCRTAAAAMLHAFDHPNETLHELTHGKESNG
jgi:hypothetical protein